MEEDRFLFHSNFRVRVEGDGPDVDDFWRWAVQQGALIDKMTPALIEALPPADQGIAEAADAKQSEAVIEVNGARVTVTPQSDPACATCGWPDSMHGPNGSAMCRFITPVQQGSPAAPCPGDVLGLNRQGG